MSRVFLQYGSAQNGNERRYLDKERTADGQWNIFHYVIQGHGVTNKELVCVCPRLDTADEILFAFKMLMFDKL